MSARQFWTWGYDDAGVACLDASLYGLSARVHLDNRWSFCAHGHEIYGGKSSSTATATRNCETHFARVIFKDKPTLAALKSLARITRDELGSGPTLAAAITAAKGGGG